MKAHLILAFVLPFLAVAAPAQEASTQPSTADPQPVDDVGDVPVKNRQGQVINYIHNLRRISGVQLSESRNRRNLRDAGREATQSFDYETTTGFKVPKFPLSYTEPEFSLRGLGDPPGAPITWLLIWGVSEAITKRNNEGEQVFPPRSRWRTGYTFDVTDLGGGTIVAKGYIGPRRDDNGNMIKDDGVIDVV